MREPHMKFLIVDDDSDILTMISKLLSLKKHEVLTADSALSAIDQINQHDIDIVITDATMPEFSGFDLIRSLKRNKNFSYLTIAMLTGRRDKEDIEHAVELGVQDYIVKPIDPDLFLKKVDSLVEKHQKRIQSVPVLDFPVANLRLPVKITRVTDVGVTIESPVSFSTGSVVEMDVEELTRHMIFKNRFRVIFSKKSGESSDYATEFLLLDLGHSEKEILENLSSTWSRKAAAA